MKKIINSLFYIILLSMCLLTISCNKNNNKNATIVRNCTGTYIRINNLDYFVCNQKELENFANGQSVKVTYIKLKKCSGFDNEPICMLYHPYEGYVKIKDIE